VAALIETVRTSAAGGNVKILVGGSPFNTDRNLWRAVGADAYAADAEEALRAAGRLFAGEREP
jgi:methanogenic corrinoid protein MtbC1